VCGFRTPGSATTCRWLWLVETRPLFLNQKSRRPVWPAVVLLFGAGCSSSLGTGRRTNAGSDDEGIRDVKLRFPSSELAEKHEAAAAAPKTFEPVYDYARAVAVFCLASLIDTTCGGCSEGPVKYKPTSDLDPHYWPLIEDSTLMVEDLMNAKGMSEEQTGQLVAVKGRLLWLAGQSMEEQTLIDEYAKEHPEAVDVVRRRLELYRESSDPSGSEALCARSRKRTKSAPEEARFEVLSTCVALHPDNSDGAESPEFAKYLPNLTPEEDALYRSHFVQRCVEKLGDPAELCKEACGCVDNPAGKRPSAKCRRACRACRRELSKEIRECKKLGAPPPAPAPARRSRVGRVHRPRSAPARSAPAKTAPKPRPKPVDDGTGLKQQEL
jgi:hypothetical protein